FPLWVSLYESFDFCFCGCGRLGAEAGDGEGGGVVSEYGCFSYGLVFREGCSQGAIEDIAGGGSIHGLDGRCGKVDGGRVIMDEGAVLSQGDDHRLDAAAL